MHNVWKEAFGLPGDASVFGAGKHLQERGTGPRHKRQNIVELNLGMYPLEPE